LGTYRLICHPDTPAKCSESLEVETGWQDGMLWLRFHLECELAALELPLPKQPGRCDGLWNRTCFEAFIGGALYSEFNFSPSSEWAAYDFSGYREGMRARVIERDPRIGLDASESHFALEALFDPADLAGNLALSAVIEEVDGTKSYWALAHPPGKPDFHHPACFAATLPPPITP
jgi:hypothetical protein